MTNVNLFEFKKIKMISKKISLPLSILIVLLLFLISKSMFKVDDIITSKTAGTNSNLTNNLIITRDFVSYNCNRIVRIGGWENIIKNLTDKLYRIDGAWFVCFDNKIAPIINKCTILSFGINVDYTFDQELNRQYKCQVESFDPFFEANLFSEMRSKSDSLKMSPSLVVNANPLWRFHRIGVVGPELVKNMNQIGWLATFDEILKYTKLENKIIDIVKMDIEGAEYSYLNSLNIDYLCKYVKQFFIESHPKSGVSKKETALNMLKLLRKLEQCFRLFKRDTRFFMQYNIDQYGSYRTEFQEPRDFKLELKHFENEIDLINFMITFGELYFVNLNFL